MQTIRYVGKTVIINVQRSWIVLSLSLLSATAVDLLFRIIVIKLRNGTFQNILFLYKA